MNTNIPVYTLVVFSFLTWLIIMLTACKIYKFFSEFEKFKSQNDVELNSLVWHFKKAEETNKALLAELQHIVKLLNDLYKTKTEGTENISYSHEDILRHQNKQDETLHKIPSSGEEHK